MSDPSTRPYLVRAIYDWCCDAGFTPYISVKVDAQTRVPMEYVKNGEIVLNISPDATRNITLGRDEIRFSARFNGVSREISVPVPAIAAIFAKENGQGLFFPPEPAGEAADVGAAGAPEEGTGAPQGPDDPPPGGPPARGRPRLQVVK